MNGDAVRYSNMVGYHVMARCGDEEYRYIWDGSSWEMVKL